MRQIRLILSFACALLFAGVALWGCSAIIGLKVPPEPADASVGDGGGDAGGDAGAKGAALGTACQDGGQCASGFCVDGVCCESLCNGTCESCTTAGEAGKCDPIPANTDPDLECVYDDAGTGPGVDAADASDAGDAGDASDATSDASDGSVSPQDAATDSSAADGAAVADAGEDADTGAPSSPDAGYDSGIFLPDGGITSTNTPCAGSCNGNRACKFPDKTTSCGSEFCNTSAQSARLACDGTGRCGFDLEYCTAYACTGETCGTTCASESDCVAGYFCNAQSQCQKQLGNGLVCNTANECASGFCVASGTSSVCCTSACQFPGGTCTATGSVGQCKCNVDCGSGSCQLYYQDKDGDGYGNSSGSVASSTAVVGCSNASPPAGFVADNTDCDDGDANVHPGQTSFFGTPSRGTGTYDYNCDGTLEKGTPEFPGQVCGFCTGSFLSCSYASTCDSASAGGTFACGIRSSCGSSRICLISCGVTAPLGFTSAIQCGTVGTVTQCGTCSAAGGADTGDTRYQQQQTCQ